MTSQECNDIIIGAEWCIYASVNQTIIDSDNGLPPVRRQDIIWTNIGILSIGPLGINFREISMEIQTLTHIRCGVENKFADIVNVHTVISLTHCGLVMPYGIYDDGHHWFR